MSSHYEILNNYFNEISKLNREVQNKEKIIELYKLKYFNFKKNYDEIISNLNNENNKLTEEFINTIENEEFFHSPIDVEIKDLIEKIKEKKLKFHKKNEEFKLNQILLNQKKKSLNNKINQLNSEQKELYFYLKNLFLNNNNQNNNNNNDYLIENNNENYILNTNEDFFIKNKDLINEIKNETKDYLIKLENIKKLKNKKNSLKTDTNINFNRKKSSGKKRIKSVNLTTSKNFKNNSFSLPFNNSLKNSNLSSIQINKEDKNSFYLDNNNNNIHTINFEFNKNFDFYNNNNNYNIINPNKSFYLLLNTRLEQKSKSNSEIYLDDLGGKKICPKLFRNYKFNIKEDLNSSPNKIKKRSNSLNRSEYNLRMEKRENSKGNICINGKYFIQQTIGKATNTINGISLEDI